MSSNKISLGVKAAQFALTTRGRRSKSAANWGSAGQIAKGVWHDGKNWILPGALVSGGANALFGGDKHDDSTALERFVKGAPVGALGGFAARAGIGGIGRSMKRDARALRDLASAGALSHVDASGVRNAIMPAHLMGDHQMHPLSVIENRTTFHPLNLTSDRLYPNMLLEYSRIKPNLPDSAVEQLDKLIRERAAKTPLYG